MFLWLALAVVTAAALVMILRPLGVPAQPSASAAEATDLAIYRDQLAEIAVDRERGLLGDAEAEAARIEISRRLLAADVAASGSTAPGRTADAGKAVVPEPTAAGLPDQRARTTALATAVAVPLAALALYLTFGSPLLPDRPSIARGGPAVPGEQARLPELIAAVEKRLRDAPSDGKGWDIIAPVYLKLGRYEEAADAYRRAGRLLGESVPRLAGFAESSVLAANGIVNEEARRAYQRLRQLVPDRHEPRFWLALASEQDGKLAEAAAEYKALIAGAAADATWRPLVQERLDAVSARLAGAGTPPSAMPPSAMPPATAPPIAAPASPATKAPRGPTPADMAAAEKMSDGDRSAMIESMVSGLAARLEQKGDDLAGWQRLIQAYVVMGRTEQAKAALAKARGNFPTSGDALKELAKLAISLGLPP